MSISSWWVVLFFLGRLCLFLGFLGFEIINFLLGLGSFCFGLGGFGFSSFDGLKTGLIDRLLVGL
jgi:hypothetical protein